MDNTNAINPSKFNIMEYNSISKKSNTNSFMIQGVIACCICAASNSVSITNVGTDSIQNVNYLGSAFYESNVYNEINKSNVYINGNKMRRNEHNSNKDDSNGTRIENIIVSSDYNSTMIVGKIEMEGEKMIREILIEMRMSQMKFLKTAASLVIFSLIGFCSFIFWDFALINPAVYIFVFIMGLGWGSTAVASIIKGRC